MPFPISVIYLLVGMTLSQDVQVQRRASPRYGVTAENKCGTNVYLHAMVTSGNVSSGCPSSHSQGYWLPAGTQPSYIFHQSILADAQTSIMFTPDEDTNMTRWRLWWDSLPTSNGSIGQTLVEATCILQDQTDIQQICSIDASLVDGYSSSVIIDMEAVTTAFPQPRSIVAKASTGWKCPLKNRMMALGESPTQPPPFLPASQACLSNCTLLDTDEACCRGQFNKPETCADHNPAFSDGIPEAYSYAYSDLSALRTETLPASGNPIHLILCP